MEDDQRVSANPHVCVTPCRPAGAGELPGLLNTTSRVPFRKEELKLYAFFAPNHKD